MKYKTFIFERCSIDLKRRVMVFRYSLDNKVRFIEKIHLDKKYGFSQLSKEKKDALLVAIRSLHIMLGISYYKMYCPKKVIINGYGLDGTQVRFFEKIYRNGLGEFYYLNKLRPPRKIGFPVSNIQNNFASYLRLRHRSVVPVGGGKDSIVTIEKLKTGKKDFVLFSLDADRSRQQTATVAGESMITFERELSQNLFKLNKKDAYNGHVPFSAILAFLLPVVCILYDFDTAVLSNEASADEHNVSIGTFKVNHQYSKSHEFEKDFREYAQKYILADFHYFSLLRKYKEIKIARLFSKYKKYFPVFSSCNVVKTRKYKDVNIKWCGSCPKCLFSYLILSPYISKDEMRRIFKKDLLEDVSLQKTFRELLGRGKHKPFECVGEYAECRTSLQMLKKKIDYKSDYLVKTN